MQETSLADAQRAVSLMLDCPVALTHDPADFFRQFESDHCFDPSLQPALTATYLMDLTGDLPRDVALELQEPLGTSLTLCRFDGHLVAIGPYTSRALRPGDADALLRTLRIPGSNLSRYTLYRAGFAIVGSDQAVRGAATIWTMAGHPAGGLGIRRVKATGGRLTMWSGDAPHSASREEIEARYAEEAGFMRAIMDGNENAALASLRRIASAPQLPTYLTTPFLGATILRIITRLAAQQAGLPPVTIDAISQTYAQRLHSTRHSPDPRQTTADIAAMVSEFCRHVRRHRQQGFTWLVRQVVDEIELHLGQPVSPSGLARRLNVSNSHLARRFKAETGMTISAYAAKERAAAAARLLRGTNHPVRDIAAHVGYVDANYFVKVFRAVYGVTPTQYRQQQAHGV